MVALQANRLLRRPAPCLETHHLPLTQAQLVVVLEVLQLPQLLQKLQLLVQQVAQGPLPLRLLSLALPKLKALRTPAVRANHLLVTATRLALV